MRIYGVVSDSHGDRERLGNIMMALEYKKVDGVIHLGDGYRDMEPFEKAFPHIYRVAGNCDFSSAEREILVTLAGMPVFLTHGHRYLVKSTMGILCDEAQSRGARAALFGHTHEPYMEYSNGILLLNPGAAHEGRYALLKIPEGCAAVGPHAYPEAEMH